jgi:hypothetical protein
MSQRRSRLQRKAQRVLLTELERDFNEALGAAVRYRDEQIAGARAEYRKTLAKMDELLAEKVKEAHDQYAEARAAIIKDHAAREAKAA